MTRYLDEFYEEIDELPPIRVRRPHRRRSYGQPLVERPDDTETPLESFLTNTPYFLGTIAAGLIAVYLLSFITSPPTKPCEIHNSLAGYPITSGWVPTQYQSVFGEQGLNGFPSSGSLQDLIQSQPEYNPGSIWTTPFEVKSSKPRVYEVLHSINKTAIQVSKLKPVDHSKVISDASTSLASISTSRTPRDLLAKVTIQTRKVQAWAESLSQDIAPVREDIRKAEQHIRVAYQSIDVDMKKLKAIEIESANERQFWNVSSTPPPNVQKRMETLQKEFIVLLWTDYKLSILSSILEERITLLQEFSLNIGAFQATEAAAIAHDSGKFGIGSPEAIPQRAAALLELSQGVLNYATIDSYHRAACAWAQNRMPLKKSCTCRDHRWSFWLPRMALSEAEKQLVVRKGINSVFWEKVLGEDVEGRVRVGLPDIRAGNACQGL